MCIKALFNQMSNNNNNELLLTNSDQFRIGRLWNSDFDATFELAISIYEHLFAEDRTIAALFPNVDVNNLELKGNATFSRMAMRLVRVLTTAMKHLNDFSQLNSMLDELGALHQGFVCRGLKTHHWDAMNRAIKAAHRHQIYCNPSSGTKAMSDEEIELGLVAWGKLIDYITERLKYVAHYENVAVAPDTVRRKNKCNWTPDKQRRSALLHIFDRFRRK